MSNDIAIRVEGVGKKFTVGELATIGDLGRLITAPLRAIGLGSAPTQDTADNGGSIRDHHVKRHDYWALKDISFEVRRGEVLGIIGRNGAGKSTLLKILSRITAPTTGRIEMFGRVASLLEVGTGFHPELTGRENIYLNGAILGMNKTEVNTKFDAIVDFAGVQEFVDTPIKRYSSGMRVRLGFAVAAHLEPEILIVDEVLAVGDVAFQRKCLGKMQEVAESGRTVLFVSHNMGAVQQLCSRGIFLRNSMVHTDAAVSDAVAAYLGSIEQSASEDIIDRGERAGAGDIRIAAVSVRVDEDAPHGHLMTGQPALFTFDLEGKDLSADIVFTVYDHRGQPICRFTSFECGVGDATARRYTCAIDEWPLVPGRYRINAAVFAGGESQDHLEGAAVFDVEPGTVGGRSIGHDANYGCVAVAHNWLTPSDANP